MSDVQENAKQAAVGPLQPLISSGDDNSSDFQTAMKVKKDDNNSDLKNLSLKLSTQEEGTETSTGAVRCTACRGTGAVMCSSQKSLGGVREHNSADE